MSGSETTSRPTVTQLPKNVFVLKKFVPELAQPFLLRKCLAYKDPFQVQAQDQVYTPLFTFNWPNSAFDLTKDSSLEEKYPDYFQGIVQVGTSAIARIHEHLTATKEQVSEASSSFSSTTAQVVPLPVAKTTNIESQKCKKDLLSVPASFNAKALRGILYPKDGILHAHTDMLMGWVLLLSLGDSCDFFYGAWDESEPGYQTIRLESGDCVFMNGQTLPHGVANIVPDSAPTFWNQGIEDKWLPASWRRFNLQWRDTQGIL